MDTGSKSRLTTRLGMVIKAMLAGLGVISIPAAGHAATNFEEASRENTVESYTSFILRGGDKEEIEQAFCSLNGLDSTAASQAAASYGDSTGTDVGFESCATTGSARLYII